MSRTATILSLAAVSFATALWLTGQLRVYAVRMRLIDEVNPRGSHQLPTPRGGGASIVITATLGFIISAAALHFPIGQATGIIGGGLLVALIGWLDDHGHVHPAVRLTAHFVASAWAVAWIGPLSLELLPFWEGGITIVEWPLTVVLIAWMINLFNFMDGIDGLAGSEAVCVAVGGGIMLWLSGADSGTIAAPIFLAAAALGFLRWNWPPAKIFMGDASSGFLGFTLGAFALIAGRLSSEQGYAWFILLGVFVTDATVTVIRRTLRGEKVHEAHCSHAYQRLAQRRGAHLPITMGAIGITCLWLFPIAYCVATRLMGPVAAIFVAYAPLVVGALLAGAGSEGPPPPGAARLRESNPASLLTDRPCDR